MNQKTNKIIVLISFIIFLLVIFYIFNLSKKQKETPVSLQPAIDLSTFDGRAQFLYKECSLSGSFLMNICRYSPLQKSFPVTEKKEILRNNQKTTISVVHFGDLDIFKINLNPLLTEEEYKEIADKLPQDFKLCFRITPLLEKIKIFPEETFEVKALDVFCTKNLSKNNLPEFSFLGYVPYPSKENEEISISLFVVPKDYVFKSLASIPIYDFTSLVSFVPAIIEK